MADRSRIGSIQSLDACIGGILFADVVGFTRLQSDEDVLAFFREFLGTVAELIDNGKDQPIARNTWGDGMYFVFENVLATGQFALALCDLVSTADWAITGLPHDLNIRVAVHAGPLYGFNDPITRSPTWSGKHVARAARIEPITPPGTVYASREFAAITAAQGISEFRCEPVGKVPLAKKQGLASIYVVLPIVKSSGRAS